MSEEDLKEWQEFYVFVFGFEANGLGVSADKGHLHRTHNGTHNRTHYRTQTTLLGVLND